MKFEDVAILDPNMIELTKIAAVWKLMFGFRAHDYFLILEAL